MQVLAHTDGNESQEVMWISCRTQFGESIQVYIIDWGSDFLSEHPYGHMLCVGPLIFIIITIS